VELALTIVTLALVVVAVSAVASRFSISAHLTLVVVGFAASYAPVVPDVVLSSELVLVGLLPPLLYAAAIRTSLVEFHRNKRPIMLLSVGLVIFNTVMIGLLVSWLLPIEPAAAFALGAVVAPPDAVAATTIARRVGMPRRVVTILEGEGLINDATALVALRAALAALAGGIGLLDIAWDFALSVGGGLLIGAAVAYVVGQLRRRIDDLLVDVSLSLLTPWLAYLPAEEVHASGVLAVVVAGLLLGHTSSTMQTASSRVFQRTIWSTLSFLLENIVFLLIGMQVRSVVEALGSSDISAGRIAFAAMVTLAAVIALRLVWVFPSTYLARLVPAVRRTDPSPPWQLPFLIGWAGMRGVVTLAAVFLIPPATAHREVLVALAFVVTAGTLLIQGTTLPLTVRLLGLSGPDPAEDHLQEAVVFQRAATKGIEQLEQDLTGAENRDVVERLRTRSLERANAVWERLGTNNDPPSRQYVRLRIAMLQAERREVLGVRRGGEIDAEVLRNVLDAIDVEETMLDRAYVEHEQDRDNDIVPPPHLEGCRHLKEYEEPPRPRTPAGCEECLRDGLEWVHLRLCMNCGHVGCCDSSVGNHASGHWDSEHHPVIRSFEPGEAWRWCFEDQRTG
jgi:CPA1 family monovalent cation:H+ antiporter